MLYILRWIGRYPMSNSVSEFIVDTWQWAPPTHDGHVTTEMLFASAVLCFDKKNIAYSAKLLSLRWTKR